MSKMYLVQLPLEMLMSEDETDKLDRLHMEFPLLEILPPDEMDSALRNCLLKTGWKEAAEGELVCDGKNGTRWKINTGNKKLTVEIPDLLSQELAIQIEDPDVVPTDTVTTLDELKLRPNDAERLKDLLKQKKTAIRDKLVRGAVAARKDLNKALKDVYQASLKKKAQQLGNIRSISESSENGRTRIRIEVA